MATGRGMFGFGGGGSNPAVGSIMGNRNLLGQASEAGLFNPMGSPRLRALRRRRALGLNSSLRGRTSTFGKLAGLDPMQQQGLLGQQEVSGNRALAEGLGEADFAEESGNRDFFRSLYGGELDFQRQQMLQRQAEKAASSGARGGMFGGILGSALNFIPGFGAAKSIYDSTGRGSSWD